MPEIPHDLFTLEEHRILSAWFEVHPPVAARRLTLCSALDKVSAPTDVEEPQNDPAATAVAHILQGTPDRWLPRWQAAYGPDVSATAATVTTRSPSRDHVLRPQHLLTATWRFARSDEPTTISYYLTWVPGYDRYVVSRAVCATRRTGDTALGHYGIDVPLLEGLRDILLADWAQLAHDGIGRWSAIRSTGQLTFQLIETWADLVWPDSEIAVRPSDWEALHGCGDHTRAMGIHGGDRI